MERSDPCEVVSAYRMSVRHLPGPRTARREAPPREQVAASEADLHVARHHGIGASGCQKAISVEHQGLCTCPLSNPGAVA
jgi:hypothetical protein